MKQVAAFTAQTSTNAVWCHPSVRHKFPFVATTQEPMHAPAGQVTLEMVTVASVSFILVSFVYQSWFWFQSILKYSAFIPLNHKIRLVSVNNQCFFIMKSCNLKIQPFGLILFVPTSFVINFYFPQILKKVASSILSQSALTPITLNCEANMKYFYSAFFKTRSSYPTFQRKENLVAKDIEIYILASLHIEGYLNHFSF